MHDASSSPLCEHVQALKDGLRFRVYKRIAGIDCVYLPRDLRRTCFQVAGKTQVAACEVEHVGVALR